MRCLDSTFCIDLLNGSERALHRVRALESEGERLAVAAPALTEFLVGAFAGGGRRLAQALEFVAQLEVLEVTEDVAIEAARLGGECFRRGASVGNIDLLIAATAKRHHAIILTRDADFSRIPEIMIENY